VARGTTLFTVVRSNVLELAASLPARQAGDIHASQRVEFAAGARQFTGHLARGNPTINPTSRALEFYVEVPNGDGAIKGNEFVTGRIIGKTVNDAVLVPTSAVRQSQSTGTPYVYAIANGAVDRRNVALGIVDEASGMAQVVD